MIASGDMPAWRNGLARWTSNPKVVGSNPTVGAFAQKNLFIWLARSTVNRKVGGSSPPGTDSVLRQNYGQSRWTSALDF